MESATTRAAGLHAGTAAAVASVGIFGASLAVSSMVGSAGIPEAAASQIRRAIDVGGWALVVLGAVFGAGITSALITTVRNILFRACPTQSVAAS
ncbi:hypothetical protein [Arthrobacter sp. AZCC_0090]|uniref:hypothetical protein n=1 Tax=Arthrobacter sp. AZCC_0090 TaxID=2735881 RepID=UPI001621D4EF|nr:hypothetical protein [Arthrobacter sp. AZCC_0090]MBB6403774.1 hypothetical protein [Arthrobacter sp. AZCC_0090]